jgi:hypothetical protein
MSDYAGPARGTNETFKAYKQRQRLSALVLRNRRREAAGGSLSAREKRRSNPDFKAGTYGRNLLAEFDGKGVNWSKKRRASNAKRAKRYVNREPIATP